MAKKLLDKMKMPAKKNADKESDDFMSDLDMGSAPETQDEDAEEASESPEEEKAEGPEGEKSEEEVHKYLADCSDEDLKMEMESRGFTVLDKDEESAKSDSDNEPKDSDYQSQMPEELRNSGMDKSESMV